MDARIWVEMASGTHIDVRPAPLANGKEADSGEKRSSNHEPGPRA
ncbi:MAG: hypothetical protein WA294_07770 [Acidobacteriaceae bacterium]